MLHEFITYLIERLEVDLEDLLEDFALGAGLNADQRDYLLLLVNHDRADEGDED